MKKRIIVLGSTGSIGRSFLNILKKDANNCEILLLTINRNILELLKQLKVFKVKNIIVHNETSYLKIKKILENTKINVYNNYDSIFKILSPIFLYTLLATIIENLEINGIYFIASNELL